MPRTGGVFCGQRTKKRAPRARQDFHRNGCCGGFSPRFPCSLPLPRLSRGRQLPTDVFFRFRPRTPPQTKRQSAAPRREDEAGTGGTKTVRPAIETDIVYQKPAALSSAAPRISGSPRQKIMAFAALTARPRSFRVHFSSVPFPRRRARRATLLFQPSAATKDRAVDIFAPNCYNQSEIFGGGSA